jgi:hypothetical protein
VVVVDNKWITKYPLKVSLYVKRTTKIFNATICTRNNNEASLQRGLFRRIPKDQVRPRRAVLMNIRVSITRDNQQLVGTSACSASTWGNAQQGICRLGFWENAN